MRYFFLLFILSLFSLSQSIPTRYCVTFSNNKYTIGKDSDDENCVATGFYEDLRTTEGWAHLAITSDSKYTNSQQMHASGFLEGYVTANLIKASWQNAQNLMHNVTIQQLLYNFLVENYNYMEQKVKTNSDENSDSNYDYWNLAGLQIERFKGLKNGYQKSHYGKEYPMKHEYFLTLAAGADVMDIIMKWIPMDFAEMTPEEAWLNTMRISSRCSALIKATSESELYLAHNSWAGYTNLIKIFKRLTFNLKGIKSKTQIFSSYPGFLHSGDDFYLMPNTKLAVTETTNGIYNNDLYDLVTPTSGLLNWIRQFVANSMSETAEEWINNYSKYNSGTNNNQWMIVDYKKATDSHHKMIFPFPKKTFFILEQIPGTIRHQDVTDFLNENRYWPSYNIPFIHEIYNLSGYDFMKEKFGDTYDYNLCPRALIYARDHTKLVNKDKIKHFMQYNNYTADPIAQNDPTWTISARGDLYDTPEAEGGIDTKLINIHNVFFGNKVDIIAGPTHETVPVFNFSKAFPEMEVFEIADIWNFNWTISTQPHTKFPNTFPFYMTILCIISGMIIAFLIGYAVYRKCRRMKKYGAQSTQSPLEYQQLIN